MTTDFQSLFSPFFNELADEAGEIALPLFRSGLSIDTKSDRSPVTQADRAIEQKLRGMVEKAFPNHGFIGEEFGSIRPEADFVWVLDPIDGTRAFMTGKPLFGTIIGLLHNGKPIMGAVDQPFTKERWLGIAGQAAFLNGKPIRVAPGRKLADCRLFTGSPAMFMEDGFDFNIWLRLCQTAKWPQYGCDCYAYGLMAMGQADLVVERDLKLYDIAGIAPIVTGAGGVCVDWNLNQVDQNFKGEIIAASTQELAEETAAFMRG